MSNINRIVRSGRLGSDVEMKYFEGGSQVASFSFASNQYDSKKKEDKPLWFKVTVWGKQAEFVNTYAQKGSFAIIDGELDVEEWEHEGQKKYKLVIKASNIDLVKTDSQPTNTACAAEANNEEPEIGEDEIPF